MDRTTDAARRPTPAFWRSFPMFEGIGDAALSDLAQGARRQEWPAGTVLFQRGDRGDYLVALESGRVRLSVAAPDGRELALAHAEAGDILGELALLDAEPRSADATALAPSAGYVLARAHFDRVAARHPDLMAEIVRFLCRRLRATNDRLEALALYGLEARLALFLIQALRAIHGADLPSEARLRLDFSQSELAILLGASRPKVNRALLHLGEIGAIRREGDVLICDLARLREAAEPPER